MSQRASREKHGMPWKYRCLWPAGPRGQVGWHLGVFLRTGGNQVKSREDKAGRKITVQNFRLNIVELGLRSGENDPASLYYFSSLDPWQ